MNFWCVTRVTCVIWVNLCSFNEDCVSVFAGYQLENINVYNFDLYIHKINCLVKKFVFLQAIEVRSQKDIINDAIMSMTLQKALKFSCSYLNKCVIILSFQISKHLNQLEYWKKVEDRSCFLHFFYTVCIKKNGTLELSAKTFNILEWMTNLKT